MKNIYLENRGIIAGISKQNVTKPGEKHADGMSYPAIDMSVALSMFDSDMKNGTSLYCESYPDGLREQYTALSAEELAAQTTEFLDELRRCTQSGEPFVKKAF